LAWAAAFCLEEQKHRHGVILAVQGDYKSAFSLFWPEVTDQVRREWGDPTEATEVGACGIAILLVDALTGYHIVKRSWRNTGFDYWLGKKKDDLIQYAARLEVSGIRRGTERIKGRARAKFAQTERSEGSGIPAIVVVVEFGKPAATVDRR